MRSGARHRNSCRGFQLRRRGWSNAARLSALRSGRDQKSVGEKDRRERECCGVARECIYATAIFAVRSNHALSKGGGAGRRGRKNERGQSRSFHHGTSRSAETRGYRPTCLHSCAVYRSPRRGMPSCWGITRKQRDAQRAEKRAPRERAV